MDALGINYDGFTIKIFIHSKNNIAFSFTNNKNPVEYLSIISKAELDKKTNYKLSTEPQDKIVEMFKDMVKNSYLSIEKNEGYLLTTWTIYFSSALFMDIELEIPKIKDDRGNAPEKKGSINLANPLGTSAKGLSTKTKSIKDPLAKNLDLGYSSGPTDKSLKSLVNEINSLKEQVKKEDEEYSKEVKALYEKISDLKKQISAFKISLKIDNREGVLNDLAKSDPNIMDIKVAKTQISDIKTDTKSLYASLNAVIKKTNENANNSRKSSGQNENYNNNNSTYSSSSRKGTEAEPKKEEPKPEKDLNKDPLSAMSKPSGPVDPLSGMAIGIKPKKQKKNMYGLTNSIITSVEIADKFKTFLFPERRPESIKFELLYKGTRDGDSADVFRTKVGENIPTIVLVKSAKNKKFGGYCEVNWQIKGNSSYKTDPNAFLFSLDKMKKYKVKNPDKAIICFPSCLFCFCSGDFFLPTGYLKQNGGEKKEKDAYDSKDFDLSGEEKFKVGEVEVYRVNFE